MMSTPSTKISVGRVVIEFPMPSPTGTVVPAASGTRVTNPASTRPMNAMKQPMPAAIDALSSVGIAVKTRGAQARDGQQHDDDAVDDHETHRLGPGDLRRDAHREEDC